MDKPKKTVRSRGWCFTIIIDYETKVWDVPDQLPLGVTYMVCQLEEAPTTGMHHIQGYLHTITVKSMKQIKQLLDCEWAHLTAANGTAQQNRTYCTKEDTRVQYGGPWELGAIPRPGDRTDIHLVQEMAEKGLTLDQMMRDPNAVVPAVKYHNGIQKLINAYAPDRAWKTKVVVYYGEPGAGKTHLAIHKARQKYGRVYVKNPTHKWWDGYSGHEAVVMDDFDPQKTELDRTYMNQLMDKWPMMLEVKGGFTKNLIKTLYITTNYHPRTWYADGDEAQTRRRITRVVTLKLANNNNALPIPEWDQLEHSQQSEMEDSDDEIKIEPLQNNNRLNPIIIDSDDEMSL